MGKTRNHSSEEPEESLWTRKSAH